MAHASDVELEEYLNGCSNEVVYDLAIILGDRLGFNELKRSFDGPAEIPIGSERRALAARLVAELGYFGSNNLAYWTRSILGRPKRVGYHEIVHDVVKSLNRQLKKKLAIPRAASVEERETMICEQLLGIALQGKTAEEIARMLQEAGLEADAIKAAAIKAAVQGGAGGLLIVMVKALGKKTVTALLSAIVIKIVATKVGKEVAEKLVFSVLKQVPQKTVQAMMFWIGAVLMAKDVVDLAGPASRVTLPAIALTASTRAAERF